MGGLVDLIVVGSGPSGAHAARAAVERGLSVVVVDVGNDDDPLAPLVPDRPFSEIRGSDTHQQRYFLGAPPPEDSAAGKGVGSQLPPPRQFITRDVDEYLRF